MCGLKQSKSVCMHFHLRGLVGSSAPPAEETPTPFYGGDSPGRGDYWPRFPQTDLRRGAQTPHSCL